MCETEWIFKKIFYQFHTWRNFVETFVETGEKIFLKFCFVSGSFHCFTHEKRKNSLKINFFSLFHRLTQIKINIYSPVNKYFNLVLHRKNFINLQDSFFTCFHRCLNKSRSCVKLVKNEGILLFSVWKQVEKNSVNVFTLKLFCVKLPKKLKVILLFNVLTLFSTNVFSFFHKLNKEKTEGTLKDCSASVLRRENNLVQTQKMFQQINIIHLHLSLGASVETTSTV